MGGLYIVNLFSEFEGDEKDDSDSDSELIRYENPPVPEWAIPAGEFSDEEEGGPLFEDGVNS